MKKRKLILTILMISSIISIMGSSNAHSGRTDANGGHKDKNNVSGLGPYHYHCGGYPAHLHSNGVCPYKSGGTTSTSTKSTSSKSTSSSSKSTSAQTTSSTSKSSQKTTSSQATKTSTQTTSVSNQAPEVAVIEVQNISIKNTEKELEIGKNLKMEASILPENATNKNITWSSSDESVAKIDEQGNITPVKVGTVTITAKSNNGKTSSLELKIKQLPESIKIQNRIEEIEVGTTVKLETILTPEQSSSKLTWTSSDNEIAIVSSLGKVTAYKEGEVVITVNTENGVSDSITIKVKNKQIEESKNNTTDEGSGATGIAMLAWASGASYLGYRKLFK